MSATPEQARARLDLNQAVAAAREYQPISPDAANAMVHEIDRLRAEVHRLKEWERHWHALNSQYLELERENARLKRDRDRDEVEWWI